MLRDPGDILDRWSIAKLKFERIGTEEKHKEYNAFSNGLKEVKEKYPNINWNQFATLMYTINDCIWQLEAGQKGGKLSLPNPHYIFDEMNKKILVHMGIESILIKNINAIRIEFKNIINSLTGEGFQEIKKNHLSEIEELENNEKKVPQK